MGPEEPGGSATPPRETPSFFGGPSIWAALIAIVLVTVIQIFLRAKSKPKAVDEKKEGHEEAQKNKEVANHKRGGTSGPRSKIHPGSDKAAVQHHHPLDLNTLKGHADEVTGLAFTSDGRGLATACGDGAVRVFKLEDVASKSFKFLRVNMPTGMMPVGVAFGEGASQLAVSGSDPGGGCICLFGAAEGKAAVEAREKGKLPPPEVKWEVKRAHHGRSIISLSGASSSFGSGDGSVVLATSSEETDVKIWALKDGKCLGSVDSNQLKNTMACLSSDGRFLAVAAFTADVKIWELVYGKDGSVTDVTKVMQLKGHKSAVTWLDFAPDSERIVTASKDGTVKIWNLKVRYHMDEDPKCLKTFAIPPPPASWKAKGTLLFDRISISPDQKLLSASSGNSLQWLCLDTGAVLNHAEHGHDGRILCMAWSPKLHPTEAGATYILATGGADKKVKLWRTPSLS